MSVDARAIESLRNCRRAYRVDDSLGSRLSGIELLVRALALRSFLRKHVLDPSEHRVGILLPPSTAAVTVNLACTADRRVTVNLNYSLTNAQINTIIDDAQVRHVVTSRRFLEKLNLSLNGNLLFLEDIASRISLANKLKSAVLARLPSKVIAFALGLSNVSEKDVLTLLYTSGTTGQPKGVMLSHANVNHNLNEIQRIGHITANDVLIGVMPFFHSFGFTATLWATLTQPAGCVLHYSPLEVETIAKLAHLRGATVLQSTPTLLRNYLHRAKPEQLASVDFVLVGAEPLSITLANQFLDRFGILPTEGYGTTETSPLISINIPKSRSQLGDGSDRRENSVGRPARNVEVRIIDESGICLKQGEQGMIQVRGPNVMLGYWNNVDATTQVIQDGWYTTADMGYLDKDGFLFISGRKSRFSKLGGEMVAHQPIELCLQNYLRERSGCTETGCTEAGCTEAGCTEDRTLVSVTAIETAMRQEKLAVVFVPSGVTPIEMREHLQRSDFANLAIPAPNLFFPTTKIPQLGTGKVDLREVRRIAQQNIPPD